MIDEKYLALALVCFVHQDTANAKRLFTVIICKDENGNQLRSHATDWIVFLPLPSHLPHAGAFRRMKIADINTVGVSGLSQQDIQGQLDELHKFLDCISVWFGCLRDSVYPSLARCITRDGFTIATLLYFSVTEREETAPVFNMDFLQSDVRRKSHPPTLEANQATTRSPEAIANHEDKEEQETCIDTWEVQGSRGIWWGFTGHYRKPKDGTRAPKTDRSKTLLIHKCRPK